MTAVTIYNTMVVPLLTFNGIVNFKLKETQLKKLTSIDNQARIITKNQDLVSIHDKIMRNIAYFAFVSLVIFFLIFSTTLRSMITLETPEITGTCKKFCESNWYYQRKVFIL